MDWVKHLDLTDKNPVDLYQELAMLKSAKLAGNNNTLSRANVILDRLKNLGAISNDKYLKLIKIFTQK